MALYIPRNERPTKGQRLQQGLSDVTSAVQKFGEERKQTREMEAQNKAIKERFDIDLSDIKSPEERKAIITEQMKLKGSQNQQNQVQNFYRQMQNRNKSPSMGESLSSDGQGQQMPGQDYGQSSGQGQQMDMSGQPMTDVEQLGEQPLPYSEEDIVAMESMPKGHNMAEQMRKQNEVVERQQRENIKARNAQKKQNLAEQKEQTRQKEFAHGESRKFDEDLKVASTSARKKNDAIDNQVKLIDKIGWTDRVTSALAGNTPWGNILKSANAQEFDSYTLPQLEGLRALLGGILSDSDIRLVMQKVLTSDKNPEANKKIASWLKLANNASIYKDQIGEEIKGKNGGFRPIDYTSQVDRTYSERYGNDVKEQAQDIMSLQDDPEKAKKFRRQVPPGTKIDEKMADFYLELAHEDEDAARDMARQDGYDF